MHMNVYELNNNNINHNSDQDLMNVSLSNTRVLQLVSAVNFLLLFPFMAADLEIYYNYSDTRCAR